MSHFVHEKERPLSSLKHVATSLPARSVPYLLAVRGRYSLAISQYYQRKRNQYYPNILSNNSQQHGLLYSLPCGPDRMFLFRQLCSSKSSIFSPSHAVLVKPTRTHMARKDKGMRITCQATSIPADDSVPDMGKRQLMNLLLLGALSLPTGFILVPYASFFVPPGGRGAGGGTVAKDAVGNDVIAAEWLKTHGPGDRTLTQGLKGDPTYLVVEKDRTLATYGINAVCTHLGCVVPWNAAENKFICPCHGSQYNDQGRVVRGPAPLSLALAHADVDDGKVVFVPWVETDFRTGEAPWWA